MSDRTGIINDTAYKRDHVRVSQPIATFRSSMLAVGSSSIEMFGRDLAAPEASDPEKWVAKPRNA